MSKAVANLTQSTETITFSAQDNGETISVNITEAARGPAGAAGAAGPNSVTSATTSDGTANLSLSNVTTATATVTGTLIADHIHGNLAGSVYAHVRAGEDLAKGDPVYISGSHGTGSNLIAIVSMADAGDPLKMPAVGVMDAAVTANANGHMVITGTISDIDTSAFQVNDELYVNADPGPIDPRFTTTPPTALAQPVARVERANANNGAIIVKVNGLSASDATGNTLVRRTSAGGASFASLSSTGLSVASGTITTSQPLSLTQTWNAAGVTFKGIDVNVTDTASASGSLLMDLRVGGNPYFSIEKDGSTRLYRTYSTSTNFERLNLKYTGTAFQIGTEKGSAGGTARPLEFQTDGTTRMTIGATGTLTYSASQSGFFDISKTAQSGTRETILRAKVSDSGNDAFHIYNATIADNSLVPGFSGSRFSSNSIAIQFVAQTNSSNDTGTAPLMLFESRLTDSQTDPNNGNLSAVSTRPLFAWQTFNSEKMRMLVNGNLALGATTAASRLTITGGDAEVTDSASGMILKSPDGTRYRIKVANGGTLTVTAV